MVCGNMSVYSHGELVTPRGYSHPYTGLHSNRITVNVDLFACINFRGFMKMDNFACIKIRVVCIIGSLG